MRIKMQNFHWLLLLFNSTYFILDHMLYLVFECFRRKCKSQNFNNTRIYNVYFYNISILYNICTILYNCSNKEKYFKFVYHNIHCYLND